VEAAHDEAVAAAVEHRQREALVAAGVLERVEPHEPDAPEGALDVALQRGRPRRDDIDVADGTVDPFQVRAEDRLERRFVPALGQALQPPAELPDPADQPDDRERERENDDDEPADDRRDVGRDERVDVDQDGLLGGWIESSAGSFGTAHRRRPGGPVLPSAAMAKRTRYPNRTASRASAKRPARPTGTSTSAPERALPTSPPIDVEASFESFDDMPLRSSSSLSEAEIERAAQLEAEATAKERAAIAASLRRQAGRAESREPLAARGDINAPLSVRMSHEYAYVARDVRRILLTASLMVAILAVLAVLINVLGVIKL
jgi:hypothetical protein